MAASLNFDFWKEVFLKCQTDNQCKLKKKKSRENAVSLEKAAWQRRWSQWGTI